MRINQYARKPLRDDSAIFAEVLDEVIREVPYSSAGSLQQFYGSEPLEWRWGRGCGWQAFEVARRVEERGGATATFMVSGGHVPALYVDSAAITVLDPYMPHVAPLRLERADAVDSVVRAEVDAYPIREGRNGEPAPSRLRGTWWTLDGSLRLEYLRYGPCREDYAPYRAYTFRPGSMLPVPPPDGLMRRILVSPMQNNLSIRTVHRDDRKMREVVLPFPGRPRDQLVDRSHLITKDNQGAVSPYGSAGFDRDLEPMADTIGCAPADLIEFVMDSAALYDKAAPLDRVWPEYSAVSE
ncbi:hypothetical protein [Actinomadura rudentiformis]|uniref:Uncharacterized protein n=1 Tax=Actinomadura rudentiformis TaxID=359158 RepID=A0A6H9YPP7_9ACTN|nr:hypothetical protein [Actinomadura rudentiformis]KAB2346956.1 hypothetical protein F8566_22470 [Actinomadura rudentiformis]